MRERLSSADVKLDNIVFANANTTAALSTQDGSFVRPFADLQDAIDFLAITYPSEYTGVLIAPGTYTGPFSIHTNIGLFSMTGGWGDVVITAPSGEVPLTITNATKASLATYRTSGTYSDLVNQGNAGPQDLCLRGLSFSEPSYTYAVEFLGVKGDATASTTNFGSFGGPHGWAFFIKDCYTYGKLAVKNCNYMKIRNTKISGAVTLENSGCTQVLGVGCRTVLLDHNATSSDGHATNNMSKVYGQDLSVINGGGDAVIVTGNGGFGDAFERLTNVLISSTATAVTLSAGGADFECWGNCHIQGDVSIDGATSEFKIRGSGTIEGNFDVVSGPAPILYGVNIIGDVTFAAGTGICTHIGGVVKGTITDPDSRHNRIIVDEV